MKISKNTISIVQNFALFNDILEFRDDKRLITKSNDKTVVARAEIAETFPQTFGIADLNKFLSTIKLFENPIFEINEKSLIIQEDGKKFRVEYTYCPHDIFEKLNVPTEFKKIDGTVEKGEVSFTLSDEMVKKIVKVASTLATPDIVLEAKNGSLSLLATDTKQEVPSASFELAEKGYSEDFYLVFKLENLKLLEGPYSVLVSSKGPTRWTNKDYKVNYYIPLQSTVSVFEKAATA